MRSLIIGGDSMLGLALADCLDDVTVTSRRNGAPYFYDLLASAPATLPNRPDVVYLIAAMTKFRDCEMNPDAYSINVDAQVAIAAHFSRAHIVYVSSEAAEWPNQTAYGSQKRACEMMLTAACGYDRLAIVRPRKIVPERVEALCHVLASVGNDRKIGVYRWE